MYKPVKLTITKAQQKKAIDGKAIRLNRNNILNGSQIVLLHPLNVKKLTKSKDGINLLLSQGEMMATASYHNKVPNMDTSNIEGSGLFDSIWSGIKQVGSFLKDTGIASKLADVAQETAGPIIGERLAKGLREGLRGATGVGLKMKGKRGNGLYLRGSGLYL